MRPLVLATILAPALAVPAVAACPPLPDRTAELADLFDAARAAPNEAAGQILSRQMWAIWTAPPDEAAGALLNRGATALRVSDFLAAIATFDRLVAYCPDWAEGYNQRAFAYFLSGQYPKARDDLEKVVEINPDHVGALTGLALTMTALGDEDAAQTWLRRALDLNPWVPERHMLKEPPGQEL
ncbi:MAG: tetratricopeptide repeat protein [Pseudomonadota bacterium]